ncbi:MAG: alpha/beta fold hydrolase [Bacteroidota bacterium]
MDILIILFIIVLLFLIATVIILSMIGPIILLRPHRRTAQFYQPRTGLVSPDQIPIPFAKLSITTQDGITLAGWLLEALTEHRGTIIYLHGVGDCKESGLPLARVFCRNGYDTVLLDLRAHGLSGGEFCTYGYHEKHDICRLIDLLEQQEGGTGPLILFGTSMGAAIAIQTAAIEQRIHMVIAEGCFTDLRTISVDYQTRIVKLPWHFVRNLVMHRAERIAHFKHREVSPLIAVEKISVPILFIHGKMDPYVKYEYSELLYSRAHEPKKLYLIDEARHVDVWEVAGKEYEATIFDFLNQYIK